MAVGLTDCSEVVNALIWNSLLLVEPVSRRLDAAGDKTSEAVKEHPLVIGPGEMSPPEVRLAFREDARGNGADDVPAKEQWEEIVGHCNGAEGNRDISHADFPQEAA